jgi:uncharacterized delta-60 repeat protein
VAQQGVPWQSAGQPAGEPVAVFYLDAGITAQVGWGPPAFGNGALKAVFVDYAPDGYPAAAPDGGQTSGASQSPYYQTFGAEPSAVNAAALMPDQRVVIAGARGVGQGQTPQPVVARFSNVYGVLDNTFALDAGWVEPLPVEDGGPPSGTAVALDAMNRIVVTGNGSAGPLVARLNTDGSPDATFGSQGVQQLDLPGKQATAVALQPDGHILIAGPSSTPLTGYFVCRLDSSGTLDPSFDMTGVAFTSTSTAQTRVSMVVLADGRVVVAPNAAQLLRLLPNGQPDATFGLNGVSALGSPLSSSATIAAIFASSDGNIVIAGQDPAGNNNHGAGFVARIWN